MSVSAQTDTLYKADGSYSIGILKDGFKNGSWSSYYKNGKLFSEGYFDQGVRDGSWTWYHRNGRVKASETWRQGSCVEGHYWNTRGRESDISVAFRAAEYPGGMEAFARMVTENLRYPDSVVSEGVEGQVLLEFQISETGRIMNPVVSGSVHPDLDKEALRVISLSERWTPAAFHGMATSTQCTFPITFALK